MVWNILSQPCTSSRSLCAYWILFFLTVYRPVVCQDRITADLTFRMDEGKPPGFLVGTVPVENGFTYRFVEPPTEFTIDSTSGEIRTSIQIDREAISNDIFDLFIIGESATNTNPFEVRIIIVDVNDNSPAFPSPTFITTVSETAIIGKQIILDTAIDPDAGSNGEVQNYNLIWSNTNTSIFSLETVRDPWNIPVFIYLEITSPLDRETQPHYEFIIQAEDNGTPPKYSNLTVFIDVTDANDNAPVFDPSEYFTSINESAFVGSTVLQVQARDNDIGPNGQVIYFIDEDTQYFEIDGETGIITLVQRLYYEYGELHSLTVQARDMGSPMQFGRAFVTIRVIDENDHDPEISFSFIPNTNNFATVSEGATIGSVIALLTVTDADQGDNGEVDLRITQGNEQQHFTIEPLSDIPGFVGSSIYKVRVVGVVDRERIQEYNITIVASDNGSPQRRTLAHLIIHVTDLNDHAPVFNEVYYRATLSEGMPLGSFVQSVTASDGDFGVNAEISYHIVSGNELSWFSIDSNSGLVTTHAQLDRETSSLVTLNITAIDNGLIPLTNSTLLTIIILDENDEVPLFTYLVYNSSVPENLNPGFELVTVAAFDSDLGQSGAVRYSLSNDFIIQHGQLVTIDEESGTVYTAVSLDREQMSDFDIEVVASDMGVTPQQSTAIIHVVVIDVNDNRPVFYPDQYFEAITENEPAGTFVVKVTASDVDAGRNGRVSYSIISGNIAGKFQIETTSGTITTTTTLDREEQAVYTLGVLARDGGSLTSEQTAVVQISITDTLDNPPIFDQLFYAMEIQENVPVGTDVGSVEAASADLNTEISFTIFSGDPNGRFEIGLSSGIIHTQQDIDREETSFYSLMIFASGGSLVGKTTVNITVQDVNDNSPVFNRNSDSVDVVENWESGRRIYLAEAADEDLSPNGDIVYELVINPMETFGIEYSTGWIFLNSDLQQSENRQFYLQIKAIDLGTPQQSAILNLTVTVRDVNNNRPQFTSSYYETEISEATAVNTQFFSLLATDQDQGTNGVISYNIVRGDEDDKFGIFPDGQMYVKKFLNREDTDLYNLFVVATDGGVPARSAETQLTVHILDENDNRPFFENVTYSFEVREELPAGAYVGVVSAIDPDIGANGQLRYGFKTNQSNFAIRSTTGVITTLVTFDRESMLELTGQNQLTFEVVVNDNGPQSYQARAPVTVSVIDFNDQSPNFIRSTFQASISELTPNGTNILRAAATDADIGDNSYITYSITNGNEDKKFHISRTTGQIQLVGTLDREDVNVYTITVKAQDAGPEPKTTTATVQFTVLDENDHAPIFTSLDPTIEVTECVVIGEQITTVHATDMDIGINGIVKYSISHGNVNNAFRIDPDTGVVIVAKLLDHETHSSYILNITASDQGIPSLMLTEAVSVLVRDCNDNSPVFPQNSVVEEIDEDVAIGHTVVMVTASDPDSGINGELRYSILSQQPAGDDFAINAESGLVYTNSLINYEDLLENNGVFILIIEAIDQALPVESRRSSTVEVAIFVRDVNDNPPVFVSQTAIIISPDASVGSPVTTVMAVDADDGQNGEVTYSLLNRSGPFDIDPTSGTISLSRRVDEASYILTLKADDGGSDRRSATFQLTVIVADDSNDGPVFTQSSYSTSVSENEPVGTAVTTVQAGYGNNQDVNIQYFITSVTAGGVERGSEFAVAQATGQIVTGVELDRESLDGVAEYIITVYAVDLTSDTTRTRRTEVRVTVTDVNDSPPIFTRPFYNGSISEDAPGGSVIATVAAHDADAYSNAVITYSIVSGNNGSFYIDPKTGTITSEDHLDRERTALYRLGIRASDGRQHTLTTMEIVILDVNDNDPKFSNNIYSFSIPEDQSSNTVVASVTATDPDKGLNGEVRYSVVEDGAPAEDIFRLDPLTGDLTLLVPLDFEKKTLYFLTVEAMDQGTSPRSSQAAVYFNIIDINDNSPIFLPDRYSEEVAEDVVIGTSIMTVSAIDEDSGINAELVFTIKSGDPANHFVVHPNGTLTTVKPLDRENHSFYNLEVVVTDQATDPEQRKSSTAQVSIIVTDINDNAPRFITGDYITVPEDTALGTVVMTIRAEDEDVERNSYVEYSLSDVPGETFIIGQVDGNLRVWGPLDRETISNYTLTVHATDKGSPAQTSSMEILVQVADDNDNSPAFEPSTYHISLKEGIPLGIEFLQVFATDIDQGENAEIKYSIYSGNFGNNFVVDSASGILSVAKPLDRETYEAYSLTVRAQDMGAGLHFADALVTINIEDVNDNAPIFDSTYAPTITENNAPAAKVVQVSAEDLDVGNNGQITYRIEDEDYDGLFTIESATGNIRVQERLDHEEAQEYTLVVTAQDAGNPSKRTSTTIHISIADENDNNPEFSAASYMATIQEEVPLSSSVIQITASDEDSTANLRYHLNSDIGDKFTIHPISGWILTAGSLNRESQATYNLVVTVTDGDVKSNSATVTVVLEDVNDSVPRFDSSSYNVVVPATSVSGTFVAAPSATDADISDNARLTFSITEGDSTKFAINPETGVIETSVDLTNENSIYTLEISVQDLSPDHVPDKTEVHISFVDSNQFPTFTAPTKGASFTYDENVATDTLVTTAHGTSPKSGARGIVTYFIAGGNFDDTFEIDVQSGQLKLMKELDFEMHHHFSLWMEARDSDTPSMSDYRETIVAVTDVNDNTPQFTEDIYATNISESLSAPQSVLQVSALDKDSGLKGEVVYSILSSGNPGNTFTIDTSSGMLKTTVDLDRESISEYTLTVVALDRGNPANTALATVNVVVEDVNDNRMSFTNLFSANIPEDLPVGYVILIIATSDPDVGANAKSLFSIVSGNPDGLFAINQETGEITVMKSLDREMQERYQLRVLASDDYFNVETDVSIRLTDINDNAPVFDSPAYDMSLTEKLQVGSFILPVSAFDVDSSSNGEITYLMKDISDYFSLDENTGYITVKEEITYIKSDEQNEQDLNVYEFQVLAIDKGIPSLYGEAPVTIHIFDANDHAPVFTTESYFSPVPVDAFVENNVVQVVAVDDLDEGLNAQVQYSIVSGNGSTRFDVDQDSGWVKVRSSLQGDLGRTFQIVIQAEDRGKPTPKTDLALVDILVTTSNDHPPQFSDPIYQSSVSEDLLVGEEVKTITATDTDSGLNGKLLYSITSGNDYEQFTINELTGEVTIAKSLDFEIHRSYTIQITATDQGWEALSTSCILTISVEDVDDNPPIFYPTEYNPEVAENSPSATPIVVVIATDVDTGPNAQFTYSIIGGDGQDFFSINENTGVILTQGNLDYEGTHKIFKLSVMAANEDMSMSSVAHVTVYLTGINEYYPRFFQTAYDFFVSEGAAENTIVGNVIAGDADQGDDGKVLYLLIGSSYTKGFAIDTETGQIRLSKEHGEIDRETADTVVLSVIAKNEGEIYGDDVDEVQVTIHVTDANDPPVFLSDLYEETVSESVPKGTYIVTVTAVEYDEKEEFKMFSYNILDGNLGGAFNIDYTRGIIRTATSLDRELVSVYHLTIGAIDTGTPVQTGITEVVVILEDVNDNGPLFPPGADTGSVPENEGPNYVVMTLSAIDPDLGSNPDLFTFTLLPGQDAQSFSLESQSGVLTTTRTLDREIQSDYYLEIKSSDGENPPMTATSTIHIVVEDDNDNPSSKRNARIEVKTFQSVFPGGSIGVVKPIDADTGDIFDCEIKAGNLSQFSIQSGCFLYSTVHIAEFQYTLDIEGSDGRHPSIVSTFVVQYEAFNNNSLTNSLTIRLDEIDADDFLSNSYDRFVASVSSFLNNRETLLTLSVNNVFNEHKADILLVIKSESSEHMSREDAVQLFNDHKTIIESQSGITMETVDYNPCTTDPCLNGGLCLDSVEVYQESTITESIPIIFVGPACNRVAKCNCPPDFYGPRCEFQDDECESQPCHNGGTCKDDIGKFSCICLPGFSGTICDVNINECASRPCNNNGICHDQNDGFFCECQQGYSGIMCENGPCAMQPCFNGGTCIEDGGSYRCECGFGERGDRCEFTSIGFEQGSFMELPTLNENNNVITMHITTITTSALLVYNHDGLKDQTSNFLALEIVEGKLRLSFDLGSGVTHIMAEKEISDGAWHKVEARRNGKDGEVNIFAEDCPPTGDTSYCRATGRAEGNDRELNLNGTPLSLGGVRSINNITDRAWQVSTADFAGCIRDLSINGQPVDIGTPLDASGILDGCPRDVDTCNNNHELEDSCSGNSVCMDEWFDYWCQCEEGSTGDNCDKAPTPFSFGAGSYVEYQIRESYRRQKQLEEAKGRSSRRRRRETQPTQLVELAFRTGEAGGLLYYVASQADFTMIQAKGNTVQYSYGSADSVQNTISLDDKSVSDWKWHNITLLRQGNTVTFQLDGSGEFETFDKPPHDFASLDVTMMSLGGTKERVIVDGKELIGFEGCIENFALNGEILPLDGANAMFEVIPSNNTSEGCIIGNPCMPNPCAEDEICLEEGDGFKCRPAGACLVNPCKNGGICDPDFNCQCPDGFAGEICEAKVGNSDTMIIIIVCVCVFVLVLLIVLFVYLALVRHCCTRAAKEKKQCKQDSYDTPSISIDAVDNPGYNIDTFDDATMIGQDSKMHVTVNPGTISGSLQKHPDIIDPNDLADATQPDSSSGGEHEHDDGVTSPSEPDLEHYDIENASSIAPSDIDVTYHYRYYHDQERKKKHRRSPNPLLMHLQQQQSISARASPVSHTSSRQHLNSYRNTPNHLAHNQRNSPNIILAHSTPLDNQYPMVNLENRETLRSDTPLSVSRSNTPNHRSNTPTHRSNTPNYRSNTPTHRSNTPTHRSNTPTHRSNTPTHRSNTPTYRSNTPTHRSNTPSHRSSTTSHQSLASPVHSLNSAHSVHSVQSELRSVGHHSDISSVRSRTKSPIYDGLTQAAQQALIVQQQQKRMSPVATYDTKVPYGLTVEEVARLNTARPELMVGSHASTIDNLSSGSEHNRALSPLPVTHTSQASPHLLEEPSSDDDTNDSFTCSEMDSDGERLPLVNGGAIILSRLAEVENENEYSDDPCNGYFESGSLSTLFMSDDENPKNAMNMKPILNGALKWEDFLNWGPRFDSFEDVFKDIAELQDVVALSPQTILSPSPTTTITLEQTAEEFV